MLRRQDGEPGLIPVRLGSICLDGICHFCGSQCFCRSSSAWSGKVNLLSSRSLSPTGIVSIVMIFEICGSQEEHPRSIWADLESGKFDYAVGHNLSAVLLK